MAQHTPALRWTEPNPKADAKAVSELVETAEPHRLTGVSIRTLVNGWGAYQDGTRAKYAALVGASADMLAALKRAAFYLESSTATPGAAAVAAECRAAIAAAQGEG